ncbi:hypothetical protein GCM10008090_17550 [Arenicella chitinivorans]|uniref:Carrier domain-containing protein n=2 Tax=Arenicella chitinivorans TaxID=1329800 RepID=A0A918VM02_9GAMM|nr:hypothetical protein GCM10008090_17550 [Arenicella chitinivorans]
MQSEIYFDQSRQPDLPFYNVGVSLETSQHVDPELLQRALDLLCAKVDTLTMTLQLGDQGECVQSLRTGQRVEVAHTDMSDLPVAQARESARARIQSFYTQPFEILAERLFVVQHYRFQDGVSWIVLKSHHILADGYAIASVCRLLGIAYDVVARNGDATELARITDFSTEVDRHANYLQSPKFAKDWAFWRDKLTALPELIFDSYQHPSKASHHYRLNLEPKVEQALRALASRLGVSLQHLGLAALATYFSNVYDQQTMMIAVPVHRRKNHHQKNMLGTMAGDIPCRLNPSHSLSIAELIEQVRLELRQNYRHTDFPLAQLLRDESILPPGRAMLTDVVFNYEYRGTNYLFEGEELIAHYLFSGTEQAALHVRMIDFDDVQPLGLYLSAHQALMPVAEVELLAARLAHILQQFTELPVSSAIDSVSSIPPRERHMLLSDFSGPSVEYAFSNTIAARFADQCSQTPNAIAVSGGEIQFTYRQLANHANKIAAALKEQGVGAGSLVGIYADRSPQFLAAMLGIWRLGAVYVPLDPRNPEQRIRFMLDDAQPSLVLIDQSTAHLACNYSPLQCVSMDDILARADSMLDDEYQAEDNDAAAPAYLIYTSGSTGRPKGAVVHHGGAVHHVDAMLDLLGLMVGDDVTPLTFLQSASASSDISVWQFVAPVLTGGKTVIFESLSDIDALLRVIETEQVELIECVPVVIRLLLDRLSEHPAECAALASLNWIMTTGDAVSTSLVADWFKRFPNIPMVNAYGPSETSDDVAVQVLQHALPDDATAVPIGRPISNTSLHVVDSTNRLLPIGVPGELCVSGVCVGLGYWGDEEKTASKFIANPFTHASGVHGSVMYRTGDLAAWNTNGQLMFLGRADHQVQIRGYRVELGEIEATLSAYPTVGDVVVILQGEEANETLTAYCTAKAGATLEVAELRQFAATKLPQHMVPEAILCLPEMPRNAADKIDRKALAALQLERVVTADENVSANLRSDQQHALAGIWADILNLDVSTIGATTNFFDIGGHSLSAVRLVAAIRSTWAVEIEIRHVFAHPELSELAAYIESSNSAEQQTIDCAPNDVSIPLSYAQQRIWFIDQFEPGGSEYNASVAIRVRGDLNVEALDHAFIDLLTRHSVLRTTYHEVGDEQVQVVNAPPSEVVQVVPLSERMVEAQAINARINQYVEQPFDLSRDLMVRCVLLQIEQAESVLIMTVHHIASDGWSQGIMMRELTLLYAHHNAASDQTPLLTELPVQYRDYAYWQRHTLVADAVDEHMEYWLPHLTGIPAVHNLPLDFARPPQQSHTGGLLVTNIETSKLASMYQLLSSRQLTLFMVLKAVFSVLLHRYSGDEDIVIGSPVANREQSEVESLVGFFVNTLVYRTQLDETTTFTKLLAQCKQNALDAYAHQQLPFELLVDALQPKRSAAYNPLFQIMLTLENNDIGNWALDGLETEVINPDSIASQFDLSLDVHENAAGLTLTWNFATDLFKESTIARLAKHFERLLVKLCQNPDLEVGKVDMLHASERVALLEEFNATAQPELITKTWPELFVEAAATHPDRMAACYRDQSVTYQQLSAQSEQVALNLYQRAVGRGQIVAVYSERNLALLTAITGILRSGAAYLPLDPNHPEERTNLTLEKTQPDVIVVTDAELLKHPAIANLDTVVSLDTLLQQTTKQAPAIAWSMNDLAYVITTSGSTGVPKGVMVNHRGMVNNMLAKVAPLSLSKHDTIAQTASQCFDISVWQFLTALTLGACTEIVPTCITHDPDALQAHINARNIDVWEPVPSMMRAVLSNPVPLPRLRVVLPTGEALTADLVRDWFDRYPAIPLINAYGPAECSDDVTTERISQPVDRVSIGRPVANAKVHILDSNHGLVPVGVVGEIAVSGPVVGDGYINDPELTDRVFIRNPYSTGSLDDRLYLTGDLARRTEDGKIEYLGRKDHQVKLRGLRIELEDIGTALRRVDGVRDAAVIVHAPAKHQQQLVGFVTPQSGQIAPDQEAIRRRLMALLPSYMVPDLICVIDALPLNVNGKVDRKRLLQLVPAVATQGKSPSTQTELTLASLWASLLRIELDTLFAESDFFAVGGHSLLGVRLVSAINNAFTIELPIRDIFDHRTIETMASQIDLIASQKAAMVSMQELAKDEIEEVEF